ncbi:MAG: ABC transporter permease [Thermodesulfobacteriota bacterium]
MVNAAETPHPADRADRLLALPFGKSVAIAFQSIRVRFLRSAITVLSLVLAIAFFCFLRINADIAGGMLKTGNPALRLALARAGHDVSPDAVRIDNTPKQKWILFLSLLVCVVGIVNAQLMAVSERIREIGTMKCLGALDRFILRLFLLEAGMQGLAGAGLGAVAGTLAAVGSSLIRFGWPAIQALPVQQALKSFLISIGIGLVLSLLGVVYPAAKAARMQPVDAMRREH